MRWQCRVALWLSMAFAVAASRALLAPQVPEHATLQRAPDRPGVSLLTSSDLEVFDSPEASQPSPKSAPDLSPEKIQEKGNKGIEKKGEVEKKMSQDTVEAEKEMAGIMRRARSYVINVIFFIGVLLVLCCCMCCLFYGYRKGERSWNPLVDVVREDRLKLLAEQPHHVRDVVNSVQFQSWSDSFFDRYLPDTDSTVDLRDLRDVVVEAYGSDVENHWIFVKVFDSKSPERITRDEFLEIMMYFECQQYEDTSRLSTIPGLAMPVQLQVSRTSAPGGAKPEQINL